MQNKRSYLPKICKNKFYFKDNSALNIMQNLITYSVAKQNSRQLSLKDINFIVGFPLKKVQKNYLPFGK